MDLTHRVRVPAPLEEAWAALNDPARLATVVPGAVVDEVADESFSGTMKIKLGSALLALAGSGRYVTRDQGGHRVVLQTTGSDRRGDAGVEATHTITLAPVDHDGTQTDATVASVLTWSGRPARLGDGVVADAVERVLDQVGTRVSARVAEGLPWVPPAGGETATDDVRTAQSVVDHPVELGAELGAVATETATERAPVATGNGSRPAPAPSPGPSPRPPGPREYVYRPYSNSAEPHVESVRTLGRTVGRRMLPYAGLGALALFAVAKAVRRARR